MRTMKLRDHYGTVQADRELMRLTRDVADRLGLRHLVFNAMTNTATFGEVDKWPGL